MRILGLRGEPGHGGVYTAEELQLLVSSASELEPSEREIIDRAFDFADYTAREVMVPRTEVAALAADTTGPDLLRAVVERGYSRYPVYDGTLDHVLGVVHVKDMIAALERTGPGPDFGAVRAGDLVREALIVPEGLEVDKLLARLRENNARMAIVGDEYGGMAGVVTMENLLERLVGSLRDEFEPPAPADIVRHPDGSASVSGLLNIEDASELFGLKIQDPEDDTIGGYIFSRIGHLPAVGDCVEVNGHHLCVEAMDERRVDRVLVTPRAAQPEAVEQTTRDA
jgi:CBS domain containing-hemolysin-like protein